MKMCDSSSNKKKDKSHKNKHGRNGIVALRRAKRCLGYESASEPLPPPAATPDAYISVCPPPGAHRRPPQLPSRRNGRQHPSGRKVAPCDPQPLPAVSAARPSALASPSKVELSAGAAASARILCASGRTSAHVSSRTV